MPGPLVTATNPVPASETDSALDFAYDRSISRCDGPFQRGAEFRGAIGWLGRDSANGTMI